MLANPAVEAVYITTRHDAHASQVLAALRAGKHVWVEKPLALALADVEAIAAQQLVSNRVVMVGFNRRFAPMAVALRNVLQQGRGPHRIKITVNAGRLEPGHWALDPQAGGGRIVGEACHFVDLSRYFVGHAIVGAQCARRDTDGQDGGLFELSFADGSTAVIDYRTDLPPQVPKEVIEVSGAGYTARINNWVKLTSRGLGGLSRGAFWNQAPRKGHAEALATFQKAIKSGVAPVPFDEVREISRWAIRLQSMKHAGEKLIL